MDFRLVLVRHGETGHNAGGILQGQLDIPLSASGISQSKLLYNTLNKIEWNEVWSSDLMRAWQTANFALNGSSLDDESLLLNPLPPLSTDARLRERNYGEAQGKSKADLIKMNGDYLTSDFIPPGAESSKEVRERVISFFKDLCKRQISSANHNNNNNYILIISHNGWIREFLSHLTCICKKSTDFRKTAGDIFPNTAVSQFQISLDSDGCVKHIQCMSLNDTSHLARDANLCEDVDF